MITTFQDLQNEANPRNGQAINDAAMVATLLGELRVVKPPVGCQLTADNGHNLMIGIEGDFGFAQHSSNDGLPPYMMAVSRSGASTEDEIEFVVGGTLTPIDGRYRIAFDELVQVVADFVIMGEMSARVLWQEFQ